MKRWISFFVKIGLSIAILLWVISRFEVTPEVFDFEQFQWKWSVIIIGAATIQVLIQSIRWQTLYGADEVPPFHEFLRFIFIGYFFSTLLPWSLGGDAVKAVAFGKRHDGLLHSSSAILFGRIFGVTSLVLLFLIARLLFDFELDSRITTAMALTGVALISGIVLFLTSPKTVLKRVPDSVKIKQLLITITSLPTKQWLLGFFYSIVIQGTIIITIFSAFKLVGAAITFPMILFYAPLTTILLFLPISFSGLGVREASLISFLTPFVGITSNHCVQASMVQYAVLIFLAAIGAILFLFHKKQKIPSN